MKTSLLLIISLVSLSCSKPHYIGNGESRIENISTRCEYVFKDEQLCLETKWETLPSESEYGSMLLTFTDKDDPARVISPKNDPQIVLWMPSMGHGSSPVTMTLIQDGVYRASEIFFIMPGPWEIRFQLKDGSRIVEEVIQKITI
jgi:YtkA-like